MWYINLVCFFLNWNDENNENPFWSLCGKIHVYYWITPWLLCWDRPAAARRCACHHVFSQVGHAVMSFLTCFLMIESHKSRFPISAFHLKSMSLYSFHNQISRPFFLWYQSLDMRTLTIDNSRPHAVLPLSGYLTMCSICPIIEQYPTLLSGICPNNVTIDVPKRSI